MLGMKNILGNRVSALLILLNCVCVQVVPLVQRRSGQQHICYLLPLIHFVRNYKMSFLSFFPSMYYNWKRKETKCAVVGASLASPFQLSLMSYFPDIFLLYREVLPFLQANSPNYMLYRSFSSDNGMISLWSSGVFSWIWHMLCILSNNH